MSFQELDAMTAEHRKAVGFIRPAGNARAGLLAERLRPLDRIRPVLERRYLVKGWMDRGAFSVVYGESNVGKTFLALDMALHIAAGADWHGARIHEPQQVVYVAAEGGTGLNNRIAAYRRDNKDLTDAAAPNFMVLAEGLDLCTGEDAQYLAEALNNADVRPALIVIDTLARVMGNGDENTAKDMGQLVRSVDRLRAETGAHVMVIHHSGKDASKGARGSGSLRAAADTEIELTRNDDVVMAEARKQRDMPCDGVFAYRLKSVFIGKDEDGDSVSSAVVEETGVPSKKRNAVKLTGTDKIGLQALSDAVAKHGEKKRGDMFPASRQCVSLEHWRDYCDRHSLSSGEGESSKRTAFHKLKNRLQDKEIVRIVDGYVWKVQAEDAERSHRSQTVPGNAGNAGHAAVPTVPPLYNRGNEGTLTQPENNPDLSQANDPIREAFRPPVDPDAYDPEMWK